MKQCAWIKKHDMHANIDYWIKTHLERYLKFLFYKDFDDFTKIVGFTYKVANIFTHLQFIDLSRSHL